MKNTEKTTRGREIFNKFRLVLRIFEKIIGLFPYRFRVWLYNHFRNEPGLIYIGIRYAVVKTLVESLGDNVRINENVYLYIFNNLKLGSNVSIWPMCYIECSGKVIIGNDVSIAHAVTIMSEEHNYLDKRIPIKDQGKSYAPVIIKVSLYKVGLRKAQKVFFQNTENRDFMLRHGVIKGTHDLIPGSGVNLDQYKVYPYPSGDTIDFVFIARVMKEKGIDQYFNAAKVIRKRHPETRFHICGFCEQDYQETLKMLNDNGTIIYHGLVDDMESIYKMASCIVHPTYYPEGLSNVLLEADSSGRPIITTNRSGYREVIDDGVNGFVVEQKNSKSLIAKIEKFLELGVEERKARGLAGRTKVEKEFNRKIVIQKYVDEIKKA